MVGEENAVDKHATKLSKLINQTLKIIKLNAHEIHKAKGKISTRN